MFDAFNVGIGGGGRGGNGSGRVSTVYDKPAQRTDPKGSSNTNEIKAAKAFNKLFDSMSFNHSLFAHFLVEHTDGAVLKSIFNGFYAIVTAMSERLDNNDIPSHDKMEVALLSKRIVDAIEDYQNTN